MTARPAAAKPYARAIFELAQERDQTDAVGRELDQVAELLDGEEGLREFLARPWVAASARRAVAVEVAERLELSALTRDFVGLVALRGRAGLLGAIAGVYRDLVDAAAGRVRARVRTAVELVAEERQALVRRLGRAMDGKQVVLDEVVDPQLLGGFVAEIGSFIVDGSLDGQLARLKDRLVRG